MAESRLTLSDKLPLFHSYLHKKTIQQKLKSHNISPKFNKPYNKLRQVTKDDQNSNEFAFNHINSTLVYGVEHKVVTESNLEVKLFSSELRYMKFYSSSNQPMLLQQLACTSLNNWEKSKSPS
ncbi:hypothetical protein [Bacillus sp. FDAARGOS_235]|uniref:hypothetical protein n=1 Tax=Bacillus sp. FDAARGOS_235 TaxID=1839798 RepID=UPI0011A72CC5|nr:hypothetical protein [Bacillus sp. FDAARGOS_235]